MLAMYLAILETDEQRSEFEKLYIEKKNRLFAIAMKYLNKKSDAEDAVSEAFLRIASGKAKYFEIAPHKRAAFLDILIRNISIDMFKSGSKVTPVDFLEETELLSSDESSLEDLVIGAEAKNKLVDFIITLPDGARNAVYLKHFLHLSNAEISLQLGISEAALRQRLCAARKAIKSFIENGGEND